MCHVCFVKRSEINTCVDYIQYVICRLYVEMSTHVDIVHVEINTKTYVD